MPDDTHAKPVLEDPPIVVEPDDEDLLDRTDHAGHVPTAAQPADPDAPGTSVSAPVREDHAVEPNEPA